MHNIIIESRKKATICGVKDVLTYTENSVIAITELGTLNIKGKEMHIDLLSIEQGDLTVSGHIDAQISMRITHRVSHCNNISGILGFSRGSPPFKPVYIY